MKADEIRDGDIVEIDYIAEFTKEHINEGKALVIWNGFHSQPLIMRLDREEYVPIWSCYEHISKVVGHIPIGEILAESCNREQHIEECKTGKWILAEMGDTDLYECSLCKTRKTYKPPFCPQCGARMEGE